MMNHRRSGWIWCAATLAASSCIMGCDKPAAKPAAPESAATQPESAQAAPAPAAPDAEPTQPPAASPPASPPPAPATNPIGGGPQSPPPSPPPPPPATRDGATLTVAGLSMTIPESWEDAEVGRGMFPPVARFTLAPVPGDSEPAVIGVFAGVRGSVDANMTRWLSQVVRVEARPDRTEFKVGDLTVHQMIAVGSYNPTMPGQPQQETKDDWMIAGVVVQGGPQGDIHIIARGPKSTQLRSREAWDAFVKSLRPAE